MSTWLSSRHLGRVIDPPTIRSADGTSRRFARPGAADEGLTCLALEWQASEGGGTIIETNRTVSVNNENAIRAWQRAARWIGWISPPSVTAYEDLDSVNCFEDLGKQHSRSAGSPEDERAHLKQSLRGLERVRRSDRETRPERSYPDVALLKQVKGVGATSKMRTVAKTHQRARSFVPVGHCDRSAHSIRVTASQLCWHVVLMIVTCFWCPSSLGQTPAVDAAPKECQKRSQAQQAEPVGLLPGGRDDKV